MAGANSKEGCSANFQLNFSVPHLLMHYPKMAALLTIYACPETRLCILELQYLETNTRSTAKACHVKVWRP